MRVTRKRTISLIVAIALISIELTGASQFAKAAGRITNISNVTANTILHGKGAPNNSMGKIGDFYIDLNSANMYGPKDKKGWGVPISLKGPAGSPGASIVSGGKSSVAPSVIAGPKGDVGPKGEAGAKGETGAKGEKGDIGPAGPAGSSGGSGGGAPGPAGAPGATGAAGANGAQGIQGVAGEKGETGTAGAQGLQGAPGAQGPKGETGTSTSSAKYGDITFASPINSPYSYQNSIPFGTFIGTAFAVDVFIYSTLQDGTAPSLGVSFTPSGGLRIIQSNYVVGTGNSVRTGTLKVETSAICRLLVVLDANIDPKLRVTANSTNAAAGNPQTLSGYFVIEDVGAVS